MHMDVKCSSLLLKKCKQLLTCSPKNKDPVGLMENTSVLMQGDTIVAIGQEAEQLYHVQAADGLCLDCSDKVVLPGFVDAHTHLVFGGGRREEFIARLTSDDPAEIKRRAGQVGLASSIASTKKASHEELMESSLAKLSSMLRSGTTTVEIKSGYGIDKETELKQLEVIQDLKKAAVQRIFSTYLGAHFWDETMGKENYISWMEKEMLPLVAERQLADFCDIWCDDGYYTAEESRRVLVRGQELGMGAKIHADCYSNIGASALAADMGAISADHLNDIPLSSIQALAKKKIPGVLLPGTDFSVRHPRPFSAKQMLEEGMIVALATNLNPGNWIESMQFIIALACSAHRMDVKDAIVAATLGGAYALGIQHEIGSIEKGKQADLQIWATDHYENIAYRPGGNLVEKVIKAGKIVVDSCK